MTIHRRHILFVLLLPSVLHGAVDALSAHPAAQAAAEILRAKIPASVQVRLVVRGSPSRADEAASDGYVVTREGDALVVRASRPRALLFAAGEPTRWLGTDGAPFVRRARFTTRLLNVGNTVVRTRADAAAWLAATGCNTVHLNRNAPPSLAALWKELDVAVYGFLYGCDPMKWGAAACEAYLAAHPSARGTDPGRSWEKGVMCPSDPATRAFFEAKLAAVASVADLDGVVVTLWDDYGVHCVCARCRANGLAGNFPAQVAAVVSWFDAAASANGKKLVVRTWASGAPHFLREEWVHAPGYANAAEAFATWSPAFAAARASTVFQTKVYNADCQPDPPFSLLLGRAAPHPEIAEWQITGQTLGLQFFPAPVVAHTARTMKRAAGLVKDFGVCLYAGGYRRADYDALADDVNSLNYHVWRQFSWNPDDDLDAVCREWAEPRYGAAAPEAVAAIRLCERAVVASFSPLGLGAPTESRFARTVARREDLLRYTNRQHLPEGRAAFAPTTANVARVVAEKDAALADVAAAEKRIDAAQARADAASVAARLRDFRARLAGLRAHLHCTRALDGALWRLRRLRALELEARTDAALLRAIDEDFAAIRRWGGDVPPELGSPVPLMRDIRTNAVRCVERFLGPVRRTP